MALIAEKYPELADEVSFSSGKLISSMGEAGIAAMDMNQEIISSAGIMTDEIAKKAEENANKISWTADETNKATEKAAVFWNGLVFDQKTGEVKTNVREVINEAATDTDKWNNLRLMIHDANLDSNAKKMIGEAAIANGEWNNMSWKEKNIILKDDFSKQMFNALEESGKWNELNLEQKKALLYSNTPEVMAENMLKLGLWNDMQPQIKKLKAENHEFLNTLSQSEEKLANWSSLPTDTKKILGDNYDFLQKIYSSESAYARWNQMPDDQKRLLGDNTDLLQKILTSETNWNNWKLLPDEQKNMLGNNDQLLATVFSSTENYNAWVALPDNLKRMLADNTDVLSKIESGKIKLNEYDETNPNLKQLLGDANSVVAESDRGSGSVQRFKDLDPGQKTLNAIDEASGPASQASKEVSIFDSFPDFLSKTLKITQIFESIGEAIGLEKGTNFHRGGDMIVNDQKGPVYEELVEFPDGKKIIPKGRDVLIPNAPRGTKVFTAAQTKQAKRMIPHYANGVGVPKDSSIVGKMNYGQDGNTSVVVKNDNHELVDLLKQILNFISRMTPTININNPAMQNLDDVRGLSQLIAWQTQIDERGGM